MTSSIGLEASDHHEFWSQIHTSCFFCILKKGSELGLTGTVGWCYGRSIISYEFDGLI